MLAVTLPGVVVRTVTVAMPEAFVVKPALLTGVAPARFSVPLAPVVSTVEQAAFEQALTVYVTVSQVRPLEAGVVTSKWSTGGVTVIAQLPPLVGVEPMPQNTLGVLLGVGL
ncbi:MAG: hypothetical protein EPO30_11085 [Lysobacteraceae bacterium]|nr:MAG: hypothetical protein EPO30_11085 [Xanthomonadaceae bacterium]